MTTEQDLREEIKRLIQQNNDLAEDLRRERESKTIAKKKLYETLEKYEKTLRLFKRLTKELGDGIISNVSKFWDESRTALEAGDPTILKALEQEFPEEFGKVPKEELLKRLVVVANRGSTAFGGFLIASQLFFDKALDPNALASDISDDFFLNFVAACEGTDPEKLEKEAKEFFGKSEGGPK